MAISFLLHSSDLIKHSLVLRVAENIEYILLKLNNYLFYITISVIEQCN